MLQLRVALNAVLRRLAYARRHTDFLETFLHGEWFLVFRPLSQQTIQFILVLYTCSQGGKFLVLRPSRIAYFPYQRCPFRVIRRGDGNPTIVTSSPIGPMRSRRPVGRAIARALIVTAVGYVVEYRGTGHVNAWLDLRAINILSLAGTFLVVNGAEHSERAVVCTTPVHVRESPASRRVRCWQAGLFGKATDRLGNRTVRSEFYVRSFVIT